MLQTVELATGRVVERRQVPTEPERGGAAVLDDCAALASELGSGCLPVGIGLMAGGVYTLARTAIHDAVTASLAVGTALVVATDRVPPVLVILVAGGVGWLLSR